MNYAYSKYNHLKILCKLHIDGCASFQEFVEDIYVDSLVVLDDHSEDELKYKVLTPLPDQEGYILNWERTAQLKFLYSIYLHLCNAENFRQPITFITDLNNKEFKSLLTLLCRSSHIRQFFDLKDLNTDRYKYISATEKSLHFNFANLSIQYLDDTTSVSTFNVVAVLQKASKCIKDTYLSTKQRLPESNLYRPFLRL